jgi:hypothetical protein
MHLCRFLSLNSIGIFFTRFIQRNGTINGEAERLMSGEEEKFMLELLQNFLFARRSIFVASAGAFIHGDVSSPPTSTIGSMPIENSI